MQKRKRIIWYRRLGATVPGVVLYCSFAIQAAATPHYYQYAEPDDSDTATAHAYPYALPDDVSNAAPAQASGAANADQALTYPPIEALKMRRLRQTASLPRSMPHANAVTAADITSSLPLNKGNLYEGRRKVNAAQDMAYPPLGSVRARPLRQAVTLVRPLPSLNQEARAREDKGVVNVVETELTSAALVSQASAEKAAALALTQTTQTQWAGNTGRNLATLSPAAGSGGVQVASASDTPALPTQTMPAITPLPSAIASPSAPRAPAATLSPLPSLNIPPLPTPAAAGGLSEESREILDRLPPERKHASKKHPVAIDHFRKSSLEEATEVKQHEGIGIKISIRRPKADINQMLENAYESLIAGNQEEAIAIYKQVLDAQPENKLALFGLATTYHRAGQLQLARPLYGKLLAIDPHNVEGLNNFLVLLSDESPGEALGELTQMERDHPGFSPIPAQVAVIYEKMGQYDKAAEAMNRAITLSPENLKYRYDMAIILDKQGAWADAAALYQQLITASDRGEKIPANPEEIQERLTFIRSNRHKGSS